MKKIHESDEKSHESAEKFMKPLKKYSFPEVTKIILQSLREISDTIRI